MQGKDSVISKGKNTADDRNVGESCQANRQAQARIYLEAVQFCKHPPANVGVNLVELKAQ